MLGFSAFRLVAPVHSLSCASDQPVILSQCFSDCCLTRLTDEFILLLTGLTGERFCAVIVLNVG